MGIGIGIGIGMKEEIDFQLHITTESLILNIYNLINVYTINKKY